VRRRVPAENQVAGPTRRCTVAAGRRVGAPRGRPVQAGGRSVRPRMTFGRRVAVALWLLGLGFIVASMPYAAWSAITERPSAWADVALLSLCATSTFASGRSVWVSWASIDDINDEIAVLDREWFERKADR